MSWFKDKEPHHLVLAFVCLLLMVIIGLAVFPQYAKANDIPLRAKQYIPALISCEVSNGYCVPSKEHN